MIIKERVRPSSGDPAALFHQLPLLLAWIEEMHMRRNNVMLASWYIHPRIGPLT